MSGFFCVLLRLDDSAPPCTALQGRMILDQGPEKLVTNKLFLNPNKRQVESINDILCRRVLRIKLFNMEILTSSI